MSEKLQPQGHEQLPRHEVSERQRDNLEKLQAIGKQAEREHHEKSLDNLRENAETQAISAQEVTVGEQQESSSQTQFNGSQRQLKLAAYKQTLKRTQQRLSVPSRAFSKVIHNPVIDTTSAAMAKTVTRPSGILGGSIATLLGSAWLLYTAKHSGFTYNYLAFFMLIAIGFVFGLIIELVVRSLRRKA